MSYLKTILFLVLAIGAGIVGARAQSPNSLFVALSPAADASDNVQSIVKELSAIPGFVNARVVAIRPLADLTNVLSRTSAKINPAAADQPANQLVIDLFNNRTVRAVGRSGTADLDRGRWFGDVVAISGVPDGDAVGAASFTIRDGKLLGTIAVPDATYEIRPVGDNLTSIVQLDASKAPPDHPPPGQRYRGQMRQDQGPTPAADPSVTYKLRVIVAYTPAAKTVISGPGAALTVEQWVDQRINEANQSYTNSAINVEMELAKLLPVAYTETGNWNQDRDRFFQNNDGHMDTIFAERDSANADVAILLFKNSTYCGEAMAIKATAATAFAVVDTNPLCSVKFTFTHEVGHLFGAEHDTPNASVPSSYPWAHGFIKGNLWRTMMAYQTGCNPCNRLPYWSSPLIMYGGSAMGTAANEDNARVLRDNAKAMSEFK